MSSVDGLEMLKKFASTACSVEFNARDLVSLGITSECMSVVSVDASSLSLLSLVSGETRTLDITGASFEVGEYSLTIRFADGSGFSLTPPLPKPDEESESTT